MTESTDRACDRCRERRVKCDKRHPACFRCEKLGKPCPGYDKKRKFVDEGVTLRKKYQSGGPETAESSTSRPSSHFSVISGADPRPAFTFSSARPSISSDVQSPRGSVQHGTNFGQTVQSPRGSVQFNNQSLAQTSLGNERVLQLRQQPVPIASLTNPIPLDNASIHSDTKTENDLLSLSSNVVINDDQYDPQWFNLEPESFYGKNNNSCGFIPDMPNIVDEVDKRSLPFGAEAAATPLSGLPSLIYSESNLTAPESQFQTSHIISDEREHEMAYLIRHFTESIGPWMDLFDCERHFAQLVPLKALRDVLLKNAIAAVAAKQLGRVKGSKAFTGRQFQKPANMELMDNEEGIDWFYKAANYYDKAIMYSRIYLQALSGSVTDPMTPNASASVSRMTSDDLLLAVSIFSLYESLDNVEAGWLQHLTGMKSLLTVVGGGTSSSATICSLTVGHRASFWNFARADYQSAYINRTPTLLDTEDLLMWQSSGLQLQLDGSLYADPQALKKDPGYRCSTVELVAHTLLWILLRIMNYLISPQNDLAERQIVWQKLTQQLDAWHSCLPFPFQPCAQLRYPFRRQEPTPMPANATTPRISELFFSIPLCAATMQLYHFARILLLLNKPPTESGMGSSRLQAYREVSKQALKHAYEIVGIALARPHPAVRVEMLQPLYVAGSCLEVDDERRIVVDLLRAIAKDTGCETEGRVRELMREWGWNYDIDEQLLGMRV